MAQKVVAPLHGLSGSTFHFVPGARPPWTAVFERLEPRAELTRKALRERSELGELRPPIVDALEPFHQEEHRSNLPGRSTGVIEEP
jgi:hypothetical protein